MGVPYGIQVIVASLNAWNLEPRTQNLFRLLTSRSEPKNRCRKVELLRRAEVRESGNDEATV